MLTEDLIKVVGADEILGLPTATAATTTPFSPKDLSG